MKRIIILGILLCISLFTMNANETAKMRTALGLYGGLNINMHTPEFNLTENLFNQNKTSLFANGGLIGNFPITDMFVISGRIGYNGLYGKLNSEIEGNEMEAQLHFLEVSPILQIHIPNTDLYFLAGLESGIPLSAKYEGNFIEGTQDIDSPEMRFALAAGVGYAIKLSETVKLIPEASFRFPFTKVSKVEQFDSWEIPQVRVGFALTFDLAKKQEVIEEEKIESSLNVGMKSVSYLDRDGSKYPLQSIKVEDLQYSELFPYLPYVFFSENSPTPSADAQIVVDKTERGVFTMETLDADAMIINIRTLDIMGLRLQQNPNAELTITGTNDNRNEKNARNLSSRRAEFAKNYLVDKYKINEARINVRALNLPERPSSSTDPDGVAENRRIEFSSSNQRLFDPIVITGDNQRLATPDLIEFVPAIESTHPINSWKLDIYQADKNLRSFKGDSEPDALQWVITPNALANRQLPVEYNLTVENQGGLKRTYTGRIPVEYISISRKKSEDLPDKTISKYSLVLFDFDKAEVSKADMEIIDKYIAPSIKFNSTVEIYGYTDRIGDANYNKQLAERRANAVKSVLEKKVPSARFRVIGVGESVLIFDNNSPVGRQLSRTVQVVVTTPK